MLEPSRIKDYISLVKSYEGENDYILSLKSRFNNSRTTLLPQNKLTIYKRTIGK